MFTTFVTALDWSGTAVFALTGALMAARRQMDIFGFGALAVATGIGGGTIRDMILGIAPVTWVAQPEYLRICIAVAVVTYFTAHLMQPRYRTVMWLDAVGLSLFSVVGAERALALDASLPVAIMMGIATATFGGIVRNILAGETSALLAKDIYPAASLAGASVYVLARLTDDLPIEAAGVMGFAACFAVRGLALYFGWQMPAYKMRAEPEPEKTE